MNQIPNIEEEFENYIYQLYQQYFSLEEKGLIPHSTHCVTDSVNFEEIVVKHKEILHHQLQKARVQEKMRIKTLLEDLPAFTPCSDKTMGKVADEAKKPAYLTNYLERETVLKLLDHSEPDQDVSK